MISVDSLSKSFGGSVLFHNASFKINRRERVGLVGRNGHGKTTLFRILSGQEEADSGNIAIPKNYRIGYVKQEINFTENTVFEEGIKGLPEDAASHYWKVEKILAGLGFSEEDLKRSPKDLSGGFQVRLNLTKELLTEPDLLLLDEPTNYLDITSIRWIKGFLKQWPREVFIITHDRGFMDSLVTHILGIHRKKVRKITGNTEKYYLQIAQEEEIHEKTRINEDKRRREIEEFVTRFRAKARLAGLVQSRVKTLSKLTRQEKLEKFKSLDFSFRSKPFNGKILSSIKGLSFGYDSSRKLFSDLNLTIGPKDRICVIGRNGAGKTTFLKLLGGVLTPESGQIDYHSEVTSGYFEQTNIKTLEDEKTIEEEILYTSPDIDRQVARNICGAMLFEGDSALKKIGVLSGGEKSRVMLGKLLCMPINLLLLDEPSNHFDMESSDALLSAIDQFDGAVVMITHNEMFLHVIADRLIVFKNDGISIFEGDYQQFLDVEGWGDEIETDLSVKKETDSDQPEKLNKKEIRRLRSAIIAERSKVLKPLEIRIDELEKIIDANENYLQELHEKMQSATEKNDGRLITDLSPKIYQCQIKIDRDFEEFEVLSVSVEAKRSAVDLKLLELDEMEH
ncbi:MAG: ABC-F family ATP-binding cassette domain-containing protein [Desulfobacteraceae bacterium]|nr:ABC-F family ATP-binding cassette domain-containing protein [Desulfobacteraceae bacterium]MBC2757064.1 ABC-F family ATP-binding cassette domain-containing protein [Desulfobacteraceae bacterium]MBC2763719.1 ABC-F family ATP-binding cassette domain-containing protein [ANME-2 cluster archaeon]